ncbi:MAG: heavy metal translocating P-type ATPase [Thermoplasmata archaeon]
MATDPICGMFVDERTATLRLDRDNRTYFFCSEGCRDSFAAPEAARQRVRYRLAVAWPLAIAVVVLTYLFATPPAFWLAAVLAGIVQTYAAAPFYRGAWDSLRSRVGNMDLLIAVGTTTAYAYSVWALVRPGSLPTAYYFDASSLIVALILTGNYIESLVRDRAGSALHHLHALLPTTAERVEGAEVRIVPVDELRPGDRVRIRPGTRIAADGIVRSGRSSVEESILTGELLPVPKGRSDSVLAGSLNGPGPLDVEVTGSPYDSFVAQIGRLLTDAESARVPLRKTADRIAAVFVPVVLALSVAAGLAWFLWGGASGPVALLIFVTVVITACPCAFGIATPAAIAVGVGEAAGEGILYRGGDALERAARANVVLMDKTGTLTSLTSSDVEVFPSPGETTGSVLALAAGLERGSEHVLARAVRQMARDASVPFADVEDASIDPGRGVRGRVGDASVAILDGETSRRDGVELGALSSAAERADAAGAGWSVVVTQGRAVGILVFRARLAVGAAEAMRALRDLGIPVVMVTGDRRTAAEAVARSLGIARVEAGVRPEAKVDLIRRTTQAGQRVAFVGDGINDAAALATADVGLAIGTGTDVAKEAGQVLLVRPDLRAVPRTFEIARKTVARVRWNLTWALGYNLVLLPIAAGALVPLWGFRVYQILPIAGAVAMGLSSTTVVLASLGLRWSIHSRPAPRASAPVAAT